VLCYHDGVADDRVELFRRFHEAWTSGDLPVVLALVDPEIVARPLHGILFTRSEFRGPDGIRDARNAGDVEKEIHGG